MLVLCKMWGLQYVGEVGNKERGQQAHHVVQGSLQAWRLVSEEFAGDEGVGRLDDLELRVCHQGNPLQHADGSDDQRCTTQEISIASPVAAVKRRGPVSRTMCSACGVAEKRTKVRRYLKGICIGYLRQVCGQLLEVDVLGATCSSIANSHRQLATPDYMWTVYT